MKQKKHFRNELFHGVPIFFWKSGNSGFQKLNNVLKAIFTTLFIGVIFLSFQESKAQIVAGAALKANFGIDADVYANRLTIWKFSRSDWNR